MPTSFCVCASFNSFFFFFSFFSACYCLRYNHGINIHEFCGCALPHSSLFHVHVIFLSSVKCAPVSLHLSISLLFFSFFFFLLPFSHLVSHQQTLYYSYKEFLQIWFAIIALLDQWSYRNTFYFWFFVIM